MDHRARATIESDIATIRRFASSYRAYWGVRSDGSEREPVKDRVALRRRLHRQLPGVEKVMVRANTNGFGSAPPRIGIVAVAFADEDPSRPAGDGPSCSEEALNRLEMTLGVLDAELEDAKGASRPATGSDPDPARDFDGVVAGGEATAPVEAVDGTARGAGSIRISLERYVAVAAGVVTIVGTLGAILGWWNL